MSISTEIDKKANVRTHRVTGTLTIDLLMAKLDELYSSPGFDPAMHSLWDLGDASVSPITPPEVMRFSDFISRNWGISGACRAALVAPDDFEFGMSRMYQIYLESRTKSQVDVFRTLDEALSWLGS